MIKIHFYYNCPWNKCLNKNNFLSAYLLPFNKGSFSIYCWLMRHFQGKCSNSGGLFCLVSVLYLPVHFLCSLPLSKKKTCSIFAFEDHSYMRFWFLLVTQMPMYPFPEIGVSTIGNQVIFIIKWLKSINMEAHLNWCILSHLPCADIHNFSCNSISGYICWSKSKPLKQQKWRLSLKEERKFNPDWVTSLPAIIRLKSSNS